jgi:hypothetical protein
MQLTGLRGWVLLGVVGVVALVGAVFARSAWTVHAGAALSPTASNVAMNCEPGQQAVVRQALVGREMQVSINCVTGGQMQPMVYTDEYGRPIQTMGPQALPVGYSPAGLVRPIAQPVAVAPVRRTASTARTTTRENGRSWQKTALIIGGSTGAGAGIGGIIGGKKGALIGAAIGGGSASIYEAVKRR